MLPSLTSDIVQSRRLVGGGDILSNIVWTEAIWRGQDARQNSVGTSHASGDTSGVSCGAEDHERGARFYPCLVNVRSANATRCVAALPAPILEVRELVMITLLYVVHSKTHTQEKIITRAR